MNWFFTVNRIAVNLDLVHSVTFTPINEQPTEARLCFSAFDKVQTGAITLLGADAHKLFIELKAYSPE